MECRRVRPLLSELVSDDLPDEPRGEVEAHLQACESCRAEHARLTALVKAIKQLPRRQLGVDLAPRVSQRLADGRLVSRWRVGRIVRTWLAVPAAAAAAVAVFVAVVNGPTEHPTTSPKTNLYVLECVEQHAAFTDDSLMSASAPFASPAMGDEYNELDGGEE